MAAEDWTAATSYKPRLVARVKRLLRERAEPAGDPEEKLVLAWKAEDAAS